MSHARSVLSSLVAVALLSAIASPAAFAQEKLIGRDEVSRAKRELAVQTAFQAVQAALHPDWAKAPPASKPGGRRSPLIPQAALLHQPLRQFHERRFEVGFLFAEKRKTKPILDQLRRQFAVIAHVRLQRDMDRVLDDVHTRRLTAL